MTLWDNIAAASPIEGALLTCTKGAWQLDDCPIKTGPNGTKVCVFVDSVIEGEIRFIEGQRPKERSGRLADGFKPADPIPEGWSPLTQVVGVGVDPDTSGTVMTFRSSSWGGRQAFHTLIAGFARLRERQYPIVYLDVSNKKRSGHDVQDPCFRVIAWKPREEFLAVGPAPLPLVDQTAVALEETDRT
jgi:hypothetical protein